MKKKINRFTETANKYNTDKGTNNCCDNGCKGHGFTEFYYDYFKDLKHPIILEVGVFKGNSIRSINEFFNGDCEIYCADIDPRCDASNLGDNIHFFITDQGNKDKLNDFIKELGDIRFDIIIDDGSHQVYHQMLTYSILRKMLKPDGMYIMEDLHTNFGEWWPYNRNEKTTTLDFFVNFIPYYRFSDELNLELLSEIKTVTLFSNDNNTLPKQLKNLSDLKYP